MLPFETNVEIMETILFTNISVNNIGKSKPSEILPIRYMIAKDYGLNIHDKEDNKKITKILINSVKKN